MTPTQPADAIPAASDGSTAADDTAATAVNADTTTATAAPEIVDDVLIETVSIDGMCGVY